MITEGQHSNSVFIQLKDLTLRTMQILGVHWKQVLNSLPDLHETIFGIGFYNFCLSLYSCTAPSGALWALIVVSFETEVSVSR